MDSKRVINNSIALLVMDMSSKIVPLITFPWILRALGPESYGKVGFAAAVTGFFGLLASPGFTTFGIRESARATETPRSLVQKLMSARIMASSKLGSFHSAPTSPSTGESSDLHLAP